MENDELGLANSAATPNTPITNNLNYNTASSGKASRRKRTLIDPISTSASKRTRPSPLVHNVEESHQKNQELIEYLKSKWIGRESEINVLCRFLLSPFEHGSLLVVGPSATGKTEIVLDIAQSLKVRFAYVSLRSHCFALNDAFGVLASQIAAHVGSAGRKETEIQMIRSGLSLTDFIADISDVYAERPLVFIVDDVDTPEFTDSVQESFLSHFTAMAKYAERNVRLVLISRANLERQLKPDEVLLFQDYLDRKTLKRILAKQLQPPNDKLAEFDRFFQFIAGYMHGRVVNLDDWVYAFQELWSAYEHVQGDDNVLMPLVANLHRALRSRDCESFDSLSWRLEHFTDPSIRISKRLDALSERDTVIAAELPYFSKVLLVACFVASANPPEFDAILFGGAKRRKSKRKATSDRALELAFVGPKAFPFDRLRWIFRALLADLKGGTTEQDIAGITRYLECLISLRLAAKVSDESSLSDVKFKCLASRFFCDAVARRLSIDLSKYLADCATL